MRSPTKRQSRRFKKQALLRSKSSIRSKGKLATRQLTNSKKFVLCFERPELFGLRNRQSRALSRHEGDFHAAHRQASPRTRRGLFGHRQCVLVPHGGAFLPHLRLERRTRKAGQRVATLLLGDHRFVP